MTSRFTYIVGRSSFHDVKRDRRGRDHIAVGFMTTYAISAYGHKSCEVESRSGEVCSIQGFFSDLRLVGGFLRVLQFPPPMKMTATI